MCTFLHGILNVASQNTFVITRNNGKVMQKLKLFNVYMYYFTISLYVHVILNSEEPEIIMNV